MNKYFSTRSLVIMALFAAILSISSYISIPTPAGPHLTLLNFVVMLIALTFPIQQSVVIILIWLLLGVAGVPVFVAGNAGIGYLLSGWGGYTSSFLVISFVIPLLCKQTYHRVYYTILAIFAAILIDVLGAAWLMLITKIPLREAFLSGILIFLPLDLVKAVVAAQVVPQFRKIMAF